MISALYEAHTMHRDFGPLRTDYWNVQKLPIVGDYFVRETPPEDNVCVALIPQIVLTR